jgi:hypothetical protein
MATGDIITATRYNQIQATVASVLGVGSGNSGYGQLLASSQISATQQVTADHMNRLRTDMLTCYIHQQGSNTGFTLPLIVAGTDLVSDAPSTVGKNEYASYPILSTSLLANRNNYTSQALLNNFSVEANKSVSVRTTPWGGSFQYQSIFHEIRVQFSNANERRYFFNTGSQIRFDATLSNFPGGEGQAKFNNWVSMFSGMGTISFGSSQTGATGSGTGQSIGNFNLTSNYQTVFNKSGSGFYSNNTYIIKAREIDTRTIVFLIEFNDIDAGSTVDNPVTGTLTSRVHQYRATGTTISNVAKVVSPNPVYQTSQGVDTLVNTPLPVAPPPLVNPPSVSPNIFCNPGQSVSRKRGKRKTYTYTLNLGPGTGRTGIRYNAFALFRENFTITWNGKKYSTGKVRGSGTLTFNKTSRDPQTATLTVNAARFGIFSWSVICPGS